MKKETIMEWTGEDEAEISKLKKRDGKIISIRELEDLKVNRLVRYIEECGESELCPYFDLYEIALIDGDYIVVECVNLKRLKRMFLLVKTLAF